MANFFLMRLTVLGSFLVATVAGESPVAKVITLLEDLKKETEEDGKTEATSYGKFACFCKDTTDEKVKSINKGEDKISTLSGSITDDTASKEEKEAEVAKRKQKHQELGEDLATTVARCMTSQAEYEAGDADMTKAIESLNKAIKQMSGAKGKIGFTVTKAKIAKSLLEVDEEVKKALALAGVDPSDPAYKYHSKEINELLAKLLTDFKGEKKAGSDKWGKTKTACGEEKDGLNKQMMDNLDSIAKAEKKIEELAEKIASDRGDLVEAQEQLQEDEVYIKDLTAQCEEKANDFDQRSQMRNDEITALSQAIDIISNKVKGTNKGYDKLLQVAQKAGKPLSFLQVAPAFLASDSASEQAMQESVVSLLRLEGSRLGSTKLSMLAMKINGPDHFKKVTAIIQDLIEKLLDEKKAEASKKGFCDTEIAKAMKDRDRTYNEANVMSAELKSLESKKEELEAELKLLKKEIGELEDDLKEALGLRNDEKKENEAVIKKAQDGLDALNEAILTLKAFYSSAKRARVFLQAGPVEDDTAGAGFGGAYKGNQKKSRAIFDLLEKISGDFQHTISKTEQSEADAAAEFVKFDRTSKEGIASKETKTKLDKQDLKSTDSKIKSTLDDVKTTIGLQHDALKMIASLKPACLDAGGMNFKDRTTKRDEEIAALNKAMCILTPGKGADDCK